jgi:hypothetical protein
MTAGRTQLIQFMEYALSQLQLLLRLADTTSHLWSELQIDGLLSVGF